MPSTFTVTSAASLVLSARGAAPSALARASLILTVGAAEVTVHNRFGQLTLVFQPYAEGVNILAGDSSRARAVLRSDISRRFPMNFAQVPEDITLFANGIDPMLRWNGTSRGIERAGVPAPLTAPEIIITGWTIKAPAVTTTTWSGGQDGEERIETKNTPQLSQIFAYVRFLDRYGNVSDFSPISEPSQLWFSNLEPPETPELPPGIVTANRTYIDYDDGRGPIPVSAGQEEAFITGLGLTFPVVGTSETTQVAYGNVPLPSGLGAEKVVRRQILRNTPGQATTWYVDIDTADMTSTSFLSEKSDDDLKGNEAVPFLDDLGGPNANTHGFPPSWKAAVVPHLGRVFAAADVAYDEGHVSVVAGSTQVQGVVTQWPLSFAGRTLYVQGQSRGYLIGSVNLPSQVLTLDEAYQGPTDPFAFYAIRPPVAERKLVYFTPPGQPESWPPTYAIELQEDGDEITSLMPLASFLYIMERRHIYRFTFKDDPATDGAIFLSALRGCLSQRLWVQAEGTAYLLDEQGIHSFESGISTPISEPIQDLFRDDTPSPLRVDWDADQRLWSAAYSEVHHTVRFFVAMTGTRYPRHAICYNYTDQRWWIEEYKRPICSSARANLGIARVICGIDHRELLALNVGWTDGARSVTGTTRGTVRSATATSLSDPAAVFATDAVNLAVFLVTGRGKGQWRRVVAASPRRLDLLTPWLIHPRPGDEYVVGGIDWQWRGGWFRFSDRIEAGNPRDVEVIFQPQDKGTMDLQLYYNHTETPRAWSHATDGSVQIAAGDPVAVVDLTQQTGRAAQRMEGHLEGQVQGDRYVSPELSGVQIQKPIRIFRITINGVEEVG